MEEKNLEKDLREIVGDRVTTSDFERWFYTSDLMPIPGMIKSLFRTMPAAVVKPGTVQEVGDVLSYCSYKKIAVVARGGGSSGLFGAVPKKGGVVLDLTDLSKVIEVDRVRESVTAESGITWWELDRTLKSEGLTVRSYPSSAKSATVGGWMMGNGLGIGSLKYGSLFDQLLSAQVVLSDGTVREYARGQGLEWFFESEGMLGIVTKISLKIRRLPNVISHHLIYFSDMEDLFGFLDPLVRTAPCPYAVEIFDHKYLVLLKASGYRVTNFGPRSGIVLVTYDGEKKEIEEGKSTVNKLLQRHSGKEIEGAEDEWQQRFNMLRIRRNAPTVIPTSLHVPLNNLKQFYSGLEKLDKRPIGLLGHVVSSDECMMMPMVVSNEMKMAEYILALHTPRELSNLAISCGGKPGGGVGVWNAPYKKQILSKQRIEEIKKRKKELDPHGILNPGMWVDSLLLFNPDIYQIAMAVVSAADRIIPGRARRYEQEGFLEEIIACNQCGYCMNYCPTREEWISSTPRGRILMTKDLVGGHSLNHQKIIPEYVKSIFQCTLCGRCGVGCSADIKPEEMWRGLRNNLVQNGFELECLKDLTRNISEVQNIASKPNDQRANWTKRLNFPYEFGKKRGAKVIYFVGCITSFYPAVQDIARSFARILDSAGVDFTILGDEEWCCGYPLLVAGHEQDAAKFMDHNISKIKELKAESMVMTCPGCYRMWSEEYYNITGKRVPIDIFHSTQFIARLIEEGSIQFGELSDNIAYHDPCDLGRNSKIFDEPRYILDKIPGLNSVELRDSREYCNCCGSGGNLLVSNQELSLDIARRKVHEFLDTGAQTLVTACPSCIRSINMAKVAEKARFNVQDISQTVWEAMSNLAK